MPERLRELVAKLQTLSPEDLEKVELLVEHMHSHLQDRLASRHTAASSEAAFSRVWDNEEDSIYDSDSSTDDRPDTLTEAGNDSRFRLITVSGEGPLPGVNLDRTSELLTLDDEAAFSGAFSKR